MAVHFISMMLKQIFSGRNFSWQQLGNNSFETLIWHLIRVSQLVLNLIKLDSYIYTLYNFWLAENVFSFGLVSVFFLTEPPEC